MNEVVYNVTAFIVALLLLFSIASPAAAQPAGPASSSSTSTDEPSLAFDSAAVEAPRPLAAPPIITVWYETSMQFGSDGNPQTQVNILGNVRDTDGSVQSLSYRLNRGASQSVPIGTSNVRLVNRGDFNIAIDITQLVDGSNTVEITARDNSGEVATKSVTFPYTQNRTWRIPYSTNWGAGTIHSQAQVVDGLWQQTGGGVRPVQIGYDRLIAIGDMSWTSYEVLVPITTYGFYPDPANTNDSGGVGIIVHWTGHTGTSALPSTWTQIGAYGYYSNRLKGLALRLDGTDPGGLGNVRSFTTFRLNQTYLFKLKVANVPGSTTDSQYSFKVWEQGAPEPPYDNTSFFLNLVDANDTRMKGSVLLVAHRADALFGNVTVCPPGVTYPLAVNIVGGGTVSKAPNKTNYNCGEGVTLTATPNPGWTFAGWSGDLSSSSPSLSFNMTGSRTITATFRSGAPVQLDNQYYVPYINRK